MRHVLTLLATLLAPVTVLAQEAHDAEADVVSLAFAWPVGMRASIELERVLVRSVGGARDSASLRLAYELEVADHAKGRLIHYSNFSAPELVGISDTEHRMIQLASSIVPTYIVSDAGELLEVHRVSELRSTILDWMRQAVDTVSGDGLEQFLDQMLTEETLFALAAQEWNALVGNWIEAALEIGAAYELEAEEPLPMLGNALVPYRYELGASARVPCRPGADKLDCVELILRSYPDPDELQPHLQAFLQRMLDAAGPGDEMPPLSYKRLAIESEVVVVAEPQSLIPHALTIARVVEATMDVGGVEQEGGEYRVARYVFNYR